MYLCNHTALALGLEGTPDPPLAVVQAAVTKTGFKGYVGPDYAAPAPPAKAGGTAGATTGGGGTHP